MFQTNFLIMVFKIQIENTYKDIHLIIYDDSLF